MEEIDIVRIVISAIMLTFVGFITTKKWGINIPKIFSDIIALMILIFPMILLKPSETSIDDFAQFLYNYSITFIEILLGGIIGDLIGSVIATFEGLTSSIFEILEDFSDFFRRF